MSPEDNRFRDIPYFESGDVDDLQALLGNQDFQTLEALLADPDIDLPYLMHWPDLELYEHQLMQRLEALVTQVPVDEILLEQAKSGEVGLKQCEHQVLDIEGSDNKLLGCFKTFKAMLEDFFSGLDGEYGVYLQRKMKKMASDLLVFRLRRCLDMLLAQHGGLRDRYVSNILGVRNFCVGLSQYDVDRDLIWGGMVNYFSLNAPEHLARGHSGQLEVVERTMIDDLEDIRRLFVEAQSIYQYSGIHSFRDTDVKDTSTLLMSNAYLPENEIYNNRDLWIFHGKICLDCNRRIVQDPLTLNGLTTPGGVLYLKEDAASQPYDVHYSITTDGRVCPFGMTVSFPEALEACALEVPDFWKAVECHVLKLGLRCFMELGSPKEREVQSIHPDTLVQAISGAVEEAVHDKETTPFDWESYVADWHNPPTDADNASEALNEGRITSKQITEIRSRIRKKQLSYGRLKRSLENLECHCINKGASSKHDKYARKDGKPGRVNLSQHDGMAVHGYVINQVCEQLGIDTVQLAMALGVDIKDILKGD